MGVIGSDWIKLGKNPEPYEAGLEALGRAEEKGEVMDMAYFRSFDYPVHPQFVVKKLQELHFLRKE